MKRPIAIDLFSGCGGLTLGLKQAGFRVISAVELDQNAADVYAANHPNVELNRGDIRDVSVAGLRKRLKLLRGQLDLLAGCPPCQGFSVLRTRNGKKRNRDPRNNLVGEMLRFAHEFRPKTFMMENVPRLAGRKPFADLCAGLAKLGYALHYEILDAADYGVPQRRKRLILLASLSGTIEPAAKAASPVTVREAIGELPAAGSSNDPIHDLPELRARRIKNLIRDIPLNGGSRGDLPRRRQLECHKRLNGFSDIYGRMSWDDVAPTITSGCFNPSKGRFLHPSEHRAITMREAALLQTFPPGYSFGDGYGKQALALMIGNALPPEFIRRHAGSILTALKQRRLPRAKRSRRTDRN